MERLDILKGWRYNDKTHLFTVRYRIQAQKQKQGYVPNVTHPHNLVVIPNESN